MGKAERPEGIREESASQLPLSSLNRLYYTLDRKPKSSSPSNHGLAEEERANSNVKQSEAVASGHRHRAMMMDRKILVDGAMEEVCSVHYPLI